MSSQHSTSRSNGLQNQSKKRKTGRTDQEQLPADDGNVSPSDQSMQASSGQDGVNVLQERTILEDVPKDQPEWFDKAMEGQQKRLKKAIKDQLERFDKAMKKAFEDQKKINHQLANNGLILGDQMKGIKTAFQPHRLHAEKEASVCEQLQQEGLKDYQNNTCVHFASTIGAYLANEINGKIDERRKAFESAIPSWSHRDTALRRALGGICCLVQHKKDAAAVRKVLRDGADQCNQTAHGIGFLKALLGAPESSGWENKTLEEKFDLMEGNKEAIEADRQELDDLVQAIEKYRKRNSNSNIYPTVEAAIYDLVKQLRQKNVFVRGTSIERMKKWLTTPPPSQQGQKGRHH